MSDEMEVKLFEETLRDDSRIVGLVCEGSLSKGELKRMHALLHERLATMNSPGLLVHIKSFTGYSDFSSLIEDLKIEVSHRNDFSRIAVVGDRVWMKWGTALGQFLTSAEMRWFDTEKVSEATNWARGDRE